MGQLVVVLVRVRVVLFMFIIVTAGGLSPKTITTNNECMRFCVIYNDGVFININFMKSLL